MEPWNERPEWIWATPSGASASQNESSGQSLKFSKSIHVNETLRTVHVVGGADFCHLSIRINGQLATVIDAYADWFELDVSQFFRQGDNQIQLQATPVAGPSAVALEFRLMKGDGARDQCLTTTDWKAGDGFKTVSLGKVLPQMWLSHRPAKVEPYEDYTQWRRALRDDSGKAVAEADG